MEPASGVSAQWIHTSGIGYDARHVAAASGHKPHAVGQPLGNHFGMRACGGGTCGKARIFRRDFLIDAVGLMAATVEFSDKLYPLGTPRGGLIPYSRHTL